MLFALLGFAGAFTPALRAAYTWRDLQFGGFVSQGYLVNTGRNDYLGATSDGTFDFREYAANASYSHGKFRLGAQVFGQKLGVYGDDKLKLDWATIDYQASQGFGVRAGRVKMPRGLYNEALDLDSVRPFVLLPQSVYDNRLRDFNASFDGGMVYGNVGLGRAGSLDYRLFYGTKPMDAKSGANDYFNNDIEAHNDAIEMDAVRGGTLFWNTPVAGLRAGYSYSSFQRMLSLRSATARLVPNTPPITFTFTKEADSYERHLLSAEYITGDWVFAAEIGRETGYYDVHIFGSRFVSFDFQSDSFYVSAARRINRWLELGAYYSHSRDRQATVYKITLDPKLPVLEQGDFALSARFDINEHLLFKVEGHYLDGSGKVFSTIAHPQWVAARDNSWIMFAAKVTYTF